MDKKPFENPEIDVTEFVIADVISASNGDDWSGGDF